MTDLSMMSEDFTDHARSGITLRNQQYRLVSALFIRVQPHYGLLTMMSTEDILENICVGFLLQR